MGEFYGGINIIVDDIATWKLLEDVDLSDYYSDMTKKMIVNNQEKSFYDSDSEYRENELEEFAHLISEVLSNKCVIVAHTHNIDVDPYMFCVCYFGEHVDSFYVDEESFDGDWKKLEEIIDNASADNIEKWLKDFNRYVSPGEKSYLEKFDIKID